MNSTTTKYAAAINGVEIFQKEGEVPEWVCLIPAGAMVGRDGRAWNNDRPEMILESFSELARDIPIDIEHSTELKGRKGEPAPAIGWIKELQVREGTIWGRAEWTASGKQLVGEQAYRYLSPVIIYQPDDSTIVGLTSVAVTNQPNLKLPALNQEQGGVQHLKENIMYKELLVALALPQNASENDVVAKVRGLQTDLATAANRADNPSLEKFVPRADYDAALTKAANAEEQLAKIEKDNLDGEVNQAIDQALKDGKITPATADYHRAQCSQEGGLERFKSYCEAAPVIGGDTNLDEKDPNKKSKALNAQEKEICEALGISEEAYLESN